jgi:hypothetical protein
MSRPSDIPNLPPLSTADKKRLASQRSRFANTNPQTIVALGRKYSIRAVQILAAIMESPDSPPAVRVKAAEVIIERGYGKAPLAVTIDDKTPGGEVNGRILSIAEKILMLKMAQDQRGETVDLENSQLRLVGPEPVQGEVQPAVEAAPAAPAEDLVG